MIRIWCAGKTKLGPLRMTMANFTLVGLENQAGKTKDWWVRRTGLQIKVNNNPTRKRLNL